MRRVRDSNPRAPFGTNGFQDRLHKPLGQLSILRETLLLCVQKPKFELLTKKTCCAFPFVRQVRLELTRHFWHQSLKLACLPFQHCRIFLSYPFRSPLVSVIQRLECLPSMRSSTLLLTHRSPLVTGMLANSKVCV